MRLLAVQWDNQTTLRLTWMGVHTASICTRSNLAVYSRTAASPRARTSSTMGDTWGAHKGGRRTVSGS